MTPYHVCPVRDGRRQVAYETLPSLRTRRTQDRIKNFSPCKQDDNKEVLSSNLSWRIVSVSSKLMHFFFLGGGKAIGGGVELDLGGKREHNYDPACSAV